MTKEQVEQVIAALVSDLGEGSPAAVALQCGARERAERIARELAGD